tara:strand:- start:88 stop:315 length:228 start_codon:yes stop_codon:yes gene_type:complete
MEEILKNVFCDTFQINKNDFNTDLSMGDIISWDSLGHLTIITAVEEEFEVFFNNDEIIKLKSYTDFVNILKVKLK